MCAMLYCAELCCAWEYSLVVLFLSVVCDFSMCVYVLAAPNTNYAQPSNLITATRLYVHPTRFLFLFF
jgi:hypothetical protein